MRLLSPFLKRTEYTAIPSAHASKKWGKTQAHLSTVGKTLLQETEKGFQWITASTPTLTVSQSVIRPFCQQLCRSVQAKRRHLPRMTGMDSIISQGSLVQSHWPVPDLQSGLQIFTGSWNLLARSLKVCIFLLPFMSGQTLSTFHWKMRGRHSCLLNKTARENLTLLCYYGLKTSSSSRPQQDVARFN